MCYYLYILYMDAIIYSLFAKQMFFLSPDNDIVSVIKSRYEYYLPQKKKKLYYPIPYLFI